LAKIDLKKDLKHLYEAPAGTVVEVDVPTMNYLMVDGQGDPNTTQAYAYAVEGLFSVAYAAKFMVKKGASAIDYTVMPLESLWWADDLSDFSVDKRSNWKWTAMIMQPPFVSRDLVAEAITEVKKKGNPAGVSGIRFESLTEGRCAQLLHIGPFSEEGPNIEKLHRFIDSKGRRTGKHHEIYLSDIRKADPAAWKTIVRQPIR
jgi:hypothetical protein